MAMLELKLQNNIVCVIDGDGQILHMKLKEWLTIEPGFQRLKNFVLICGNRKKDKILFLKELVQRLLASPGGLFLMMTVDDIPLAH